MRFPRSVIKRTFFSGAQLAGAGLWLGNYVRRHRPTIVLNLHRVSPHPNPYWEPLHPSLFEDLVSYLSKRHRIGTIREARETNGDEAMIVLSFDDGYYDFIEYALPILAKHGVMANQNVIPQCMEGQGPPWTVQVSSLLNSVSTSLIKELRLPGFHGVLRGTDDDSKMRYALGLMKFLKRIPMDDRRPAWAAIEALMERADNIRNPRMIDVNEARAISSVCELGAHSYSHESMGLVSDTVFQEDYWCCAQYFRETLVEPLSIYSFPNGSYRQSQVDYLLEQGVGTVLLVDEAFGRSGARVYPRVTVRGDSSSEVRLRALGYGREKSDESRCSHQR